jgi:acylphosphatase
MPDLPLQQVKHLLIAGRVQGVGFRWFSRERARRRGLRGWVKNRADGSVEIRVEGSEHVLADFIAELHRGPEGSIVESVREIGPPDTLGEDSPLPYPFQILKQPSA